MSPSALAAVLWNLLTSIALRLNPCRRSPLPFNGVRQQIGALVQTPHGAALLSVIAVVLFVQAVRSAWHESHGRRYPLSVRSSEE